MIARSIVSNKFIAFNDVANTPPLRYIEAMKITFFGHAAIGVETLSGETLIFDPYRSGGFGGKMAYRPIEGEWDWVVITHNHDDHAAIDTLSGALKNDPGSLMEAFQCQIYPLSHDEYEGARFGGEVGVRILNIDGFRVCHLSDVGQAPPPEWFASLDHIDVCFLPVGGFFTIGPLQGLEWYRALSPTILIPIHYKTDSVDLPLEPVEHFLSYFPPDMIHTSSDLEILDTQDLENHQGIVVLDVKNKK